MGPAFVINNSQVVDIVDGNTLSKSINRDFRPISSSFKMITIDFNGLQWIYNGVIHKSFGHCNYYWIIKNYLLFIGN